MTAATTPSFELTGKIVFVTGASRGIGRACALACAGSGADMVVGIRKPGDGEALVAEIEALGRRAFAVRMDLSDLDSVRAAVAQAHDHFGRIDVLVNNVGIGPENLAEDVTEADFDYTVNINLKGTFFTTQAVGKLMMSRKSGRIINISSQAGSVTLRGESIYCMTKAAINHLTRCLAAEWARHGITVNSIAPTFIWTDGTRPSLDQPEFHAHVLAHIPLGRIGDPIDVAGAVVFLASPAASLITGANIMVDGGWSIAGG
ncbi:3-oxoacyl-ACP reductase family protein [Mesorhizobium sp. KR9-304]|uniref:SDR family NAD(P)-dependent oxidoreductase n=1 Tax=Mesorhizobium sp. KR9-304 TaxID=3156614 RepID=UPI0032B4DE96